MKDTIAAVATGQQRTAIGILRISGPRAAELAGKIFTPASGTPFVQCPTGTLIYGVARGREDEVLDRCLATWSRGPHSYTGEDTAELQCHGSPLVLTRLLETLFSLGARQAQPGEFTRRAFLNGKLDLTQAEAVVDLIDAQTAAAARCAAGQLGGAMSRKIGGIYDSLVDLAAHFSVVLDYSDEDLEPFETEEMVAVVSDAAKALAALEAGYRRGRQLREGVRCAIVGLPNAGKSSLLNALLGYERAIVTDIPGTTRDTVEETVTVGDVLLKLIDTAGLRETEDRVERLGVERSRAALEQAELVLAVADGTRKYREEEYALIRTALEEGKKVIAVDTRADRPGFLGRDQALPSGAEWVRVSNITGEGLEELEQTVRRLFPQGEDLMSGTVLTNARQAEAVGRAARCLADAARSLEEGMTPDAVLSDVELAMDALGQVTGRIVTEDVTSRIFERFCVGK